MKRLIVLSVMCVFVFTATSYCQSADSDSNTISDDVWTMTRLIGGELKKEFPDRSFLGWGNEKRCMGVYLKDYGAVFVTQVQFPVFDYRNIKSVTKSESGDLWDKYKNDSDPIAWGVVNKQDSQNKMNQQVDRIKRLEQFLIDIICSFAGNLDRISQDEYITIAVKGNRYAEYPFFLNVSPTPPSYSDGKLEEAKSKLEEERSKIKEVINSRQLVVQGAKNLRIRGSSGEHGQYLIMKIKKKDISGDCADKIEISFN